VSRFAVTGESFRVTRSSVCARARFEVHSHARRPSDSSSSVAPLRGDARVFFASIAESLFSSSASREQPFLLSAFSPRCRVTI
jgi:hypothetical protein